MENKSVNSNVNYNEKAKELGSSSSTLRLYRYDTKLHCLYKSNSHKRAPKTSNDLKRLQMASKDVHEKDKPVSENVHI